LVSGNLEDQEAGGDSIKMDLMDVSSKVIPESHPVKEFDIGGFCHLSFIY